MFLNTNRDFPFCVKRKVVEAAFNSAILYGCESWIGGNCHEVEKLYTCAIKYLLGVRKSTANDLCLIELGMLPLPAVVKQRQYNFRYKAMNAGHLELEDPLMFAISLTRLHNPKLARCIDNILATPDHMETTKKLCIKGKMCQTEVSSLCTEILTHLILYILCIPQGARY